MDKKSLSSAKSGTGKGQGKSKQKNMTAWVISVDMGYGHQRAAYPLKDIAEERIITANNDRIISHHERRIWERTRLTYEFLSRMKGLPFFGKILFGILDMLESISPFFPFRDLSKPNFSVLRLKWLIEKKGLCSSLLAYTSKKDIPIVTTHFVPALAYNYAGKPCYCIITDTDINRVWVPDDPNKSKIIYFSPCKHATHRLREYGVPEKDIIETGFPLPKENIGDKHTKSILKNDILSRLVNLDPNCIFFQKYGAIIKEKLGLPEGMAFTRSKLKRYKTHPLTISYLIGGSGAQKEIGINIIHALKEKIVKGELAINITAGNRLDVKSFYESELTKLNLKGQIGKGIRIIFALDKKSFFQEMNEALRTTDIIWTKPSEMTFYTALGIPLIIAPPIGSHEEFNKQWIEHMGAGFVQENPLFANHWLFYWIEDGRFADAAIQGFIDAPLLGTYDIEEQIFTGKKKGRNNTSR